MKKQTYIQGDLFGDNPIEDKPFALPKENHDLDGLFLKLSQSKFRTSFHLTKTDIEYIRKMGLDRIRIHAADFVKKRLAPADPVNDGKQTPYRGHPIFKAQHATGCCCRSCFLKWHHVAKGIALTEEQQVYAVNVLMEWIVRQLGTSFSH